MARDPVKGTALNQLSTTNQVATNAGQQQQSLYNTLTPAYTTLMDTGYLSPADKAAATNTTMGAAAAPFSAANFQAANRAAATRNPSDLTASQDALALEEGTAASNAANELQQQQMQNQEAGMYGLGQEQSGELGLEESMYGLGPSTIQAATAGQTTFPLGQIIGSVLGGMASHGPCHVSAELYNSWDALQVSLIRDYLRSHAKVFFAFYKRYSAAWAALIRHSRIARSMTKKLFDAFLRRALEAKG